MSVDELEEDEHGIPRGHGMYVKWKDKSYIHASYVPLHRLLAAQKRFPSGAGLKLKRFLREEDEREQQVRQSRCSPLSLCSYAC